MSGVVRLGEQLGRRASHRLSVGLPALIRVGDLNFTATLANIGRGGAKLQSSAPVLTGARVTVCCGTISAAAAVIWNASGSIGVKFDAPLSEARVQEQVLRSAALAAQRS